MEYLRKVTIQRPGWTDLTLELYRRSEGDYCLWVWDGGTLNSGCSANDEEDVVLSTEAEALAYYRKCVPYYVSEEWEQS